MQLSLMCEDTFSHLIDNFGDEGMTLLNLCQVVKSWHNLTKFFALQALFECLGI